MTYSVYTVRKTPVFWEYPVAKRRAHLTKEEAHKIVEESKHLKMSECDYYAVADSRTEDFFAFVEKKNAIEHKKMERKLQRAEELRVAYRKGYRVTDALEYINR